MTVNNDHKKQLMLEGKKGKAKTMKSSKLIRQSLKELMTIL